MKRSKCALRRVRYSGKQQDSAAQSREHRRWIGRIAAERWYIARSLDRSNFIGGFVWRLAVAGVETSKRFMHDMVKIMAKIGLRWQEGTITRSSSHSSMDLFIQFGQELLDALDSRAGTVEIDPLSKRAALARDALQNLIQPLMREHNLRKVNVLMGFYGSPEVCPACLPAFSWRSRLYPCTCLVISVSVCVGDSFWTQS